MWKGHAARTLASRGLRGLGLGACERSDWSLAMANRRSNCKAQFSEVGWALHELFWWLRTVNWWGVVEVLLFAVLGYLFVFLFALL